MSQRKPWIQVWPFEGKQVEIRNSEARVRLSKEVQDYCDKLWKPKADKGWKSSWIALAKNVSFGKDAIKMDCGAIPFHKAIGLVESIKEGKSFVPQGYVNELSLGFLTATKDAKVIFQRRAPNVHCPNTLIHEPCGYLASMNFAPRAVCDSPQYANDSRLFNLKTQLDFRKKEIADTFGISEELVSYEPLQDFLACGWLTKEAYFSTIGKIDANSSELKIPEGQEIFFVPFENLKELIYNQGELSGKNPDGYRPSDPTQIPMIDESTIGLIYGYENMTGDKLDIPETIDRLNKTGLEIKVHNTSPNKHYDFPLEFGFYSNK